MSALAHASAISLVAGHQPFAAIHNEHKEIRVGDRAPAALEHERVQRILAGAEHPAGIGQLEAAALPLDRLRETSRVVPGMGVTIARRVRVSRLNSVDLPTLGRPTSTTDGELASIERMLSGRQPDRDSAHELSC